MGAESSFSYQCVHTRIDLFCFIINNIWDFWKSASDIFNSCGKEMYNNNQWSKHLLFVVKQQLKAESNKHAESHTRSIKNSLRYNKANRKEKIGSWDERQNKQSQTLEEKRKEKQQLLSLTQKTFGKHTTVNKKPFVRLYFILVGVE